MAGNAGKTSVRSVSFYNQSLDLIMAACDVEANFAVVKAYQYTDLLSCMLLNSWGFPSRSEFPLLNIVGE